MHSRPNDVDAARDNRPKWTTQWSPSWHKKPAAGIACMQAASKDQEFAQKRGASSYILFCWTFLEFKDILQLVLCQKCNSHTKDKSFHIWTHFFFALRRFNILKISRLHTIIIWFMLQSLACLDKSFDFLFVQQKHILASHWSSEFTALLKGFSLGIIMSLCENANNRICSWIEALSFQT